MSLGVCLTLTRPQDRRADARAGHLHADPPERFFREARVEATCHTYLRSPCVRLKRAPFREQGDGTHHARLRRRAGGGGLRAAEGGGELQGRVERKEWDCLRLPDHLCTQVG